MKNELVINESIDPSFFQKLSFFSCVTVWQNILFCLVASNKIFVIKILLTFSDVIV